MGIRLKLVVKFVANYVPDLHLTVDANGVTAMALEIQFRFYKRSGFLQRCVHDYKKVLAQSDSIPQA